jgi:hypothetical protein
MSHRSGVLAWGSAPNPEVYRFVARTHLGPEGRQGTAVQAGPHTRPGTGVSARVAPQQSPILSAGRCDCPHVMTSVNHARPLVSRRDAPATLADRVLVDASNSRSIARYSSTRRTLQLSVYAV